MSRYLVILVVIVSLLSLANALTDSFIFGEPNESYKEFIKCDLKEEINIDIEKFESFCKYISKIINK